MRKIRILLACLLLVLFPGSCAVSVQPMPTMEEAQRLFNEHYELINTSVELLWAHHAELDQLVNEGESRLLLFSQGMTEADFPYKQTSLTEEEIARIFTAWRTLAENGVSVTYHMALPDQAPVIAIHCGFDAEGRSFGYFYIRPIETDAVLAQAAVDRRIACNGYNNAASYASWQALPYDHWYQGKTAHPSYRTEAPMLVQDQYTGECGIVNASGQLLVPFAADCTLYQLSTDTYCVQRTDTAGRETYALCNAQRMLTDFDFTYMQTFYAGDAPILATNADMLDGYLDASGQWLISPVWYAAEPFSEGMALVQDADSIGFIDPSGTYVLRYTRNEIVTASSFSEGMAAVEYADSRWGYINARGEKILRDDFAEADPFSCGWARVSDEQGYYFIDHHGRALCDDRFSYASSFFHGYAIVANDARQYGVVSTSGTFAFPMTAVSIISITPDHLCWIQTDDSPLFRLYDLAAGVFLSEGSYELPFEEGFVGNEHGFIVKRHGLYGYLVKTGMLLFPCQYEFLGLNGDGTLTGLTDTDDRYRYFPAELILTNDSTTK